MYFFIQFKIPILDFIVYCQNSVPFEGLYYSSIYICYPINNYEMTDSQLHTIIRNIVVFVT